MTTTPSSVVEWLARHATPFKTVEPGSGSTDLEPLRKIVGDARVVAPAESFLRGGLLPAPVGLRFAGTSPDGWTVSGSEPALHTVEVRADEPAIGSPYVRLARGPLPWRWGFGALVQRFDATPYRGRLIRVEVTTRADVTGYGNVGQVFAQVDGVDAGMDNPHGWERPTGERLECRRVDTNAWATYSLDVIVPATATAITIGAVLSGQGTVDIGGFSVIHVEEGEA